VQADREGAGQVALDGERRGGVAQVRDGAEGQARRARGRHPAPDDAVHHPLRDAADGVQPDSDAEAVIVLLPGTMLASTRGQMRASAPTKQLQK
jgi:hypothetical protein